MARFTITTLTETHTYAIASREMYLAILTLDAKAWTAQLSRA